MAARPIRFFADESILGVGKALAIARRDVVHPGHALIPEVTTGTLDPVWIPIVAARSLVVIARDRRIRTKPVERAMLRDHALRVFWIAGKRDRSNWDNLTLLVRQWERIELIVRSRGPGPWFQAISDSGIRELSV